MVTLAPVPGSVSAALTLGTGVGDADAVPAPASVASAVPDDAAEGPVWPTPEVAAALPAASLPVASGEAGTRGEAPASDTGALGEPEPEKAMGRSTATATIAAAATVPSTAVRREIFFMLPPVHERLRKSAALIRRPEDLATLVPQSLVR